MKYKHRSAGICALVLAVSLSGVPIMAGTATARAAAAGPLGLLNTVTFHTTRHGWLGGAGTILVTTDGGATWTRQYAGQATIEQFSFVSNTVGWALGQHTLLHTTDGGKTWTAAGEPPQALQQIDFVSPTLGWGVAGANSAMPRTLYRTQDGGHSWQRQQTPFAVGGVCFAGSTRGWIADARVNSSSRIALDATTDGGATWHATAPIPGSKEALDAFEAQTLGCTPSSPVVWDLIGYGGYAGGVAYGLYRSGDGGGHWQTIAANMAPGNPQAAAGPGTAPGGLSVVSGATAYLSGTCFACGGSGTVSVGGTMDGGRSWRDFGVPGLSTTATSISFPTAQDGWLVAQQPAGSSHTSVVFQTTDGGRIWQRRYPAPQGTVRVTFTLSLYGHVPQGQQFSVLGSPKLGGAGALPFCTTIPARIQLGEVACVGQRTVYTRSVTVPRGSVVRFAFLRSTIANPAKPDIFYQGSRTVNMDTRIDAYYRFAR